jgi:ABC-type branched-subunit amino acid transport system substrate-binding protein
LFLFLITLCCTFLSSCAKKETSTAEKPSAQKGYTGDNYKIGVILPLTGKYAPYGEATLHGVECSAGIFSPCDSPTKVELIIRDDAGLPDRAALAVEDLAKNENVSVIVGPLSSSSIDTAAQKAQELGVPLISLSQKEGITSVGDNIFSTALTAALQVNEVVNWAVNKKKLKKFAVVYPMNAFGETYKKLFTEAVKSAGGKIVLSTGYGEATYDFANLLEGKKEKFDALFIPDSYRAVGFVASSLSSEDLDGTQLLGINRWNNPELVERGGDYLQGAVFVDGFFENGDSAATQNFTSAFEQAYGIKPTVLEAQSFDAERLAAKALQSTGGEHPLDVKTALATLPEVEGSTGPVSFDSNREAIKHLFLLSVKGDKIVEISDGSPRSTPKGKYGEPISSPGQDTKY